MIIFKFENQLMLAVLLCNFFLYFYEDNLFSTVVSNCSNLTLVHSYIHPAAGYLFSSLAVTFYPSSFMQYSTRKAQPEVDSFVNDS